jgi:hypothetical protein
MSVSTKTTVGFHGKEGDVVWASKTKKVLLFLKSVEITVAGGQFSKKINTIC